MANQLLSEIHIKPILGSTGITVNAMALIVPEIFLWITYESQFAPSFALNMWLAVFGATALSFLSASAYINLTYRYPEGAYFAKFVVGWAAHIYYWVYPGMMVAFMGMVMTYIIESFVPSFGAAWQEVILCMVFAILVGFITYIGIHGSTVFSIIINITLLIMLVTLFVLAGIYRLGHLTDIYSYPRTLVYLIALHTNDGLLFQFMVTILLVVGFESTTALVAKAKNTGRNIWSAILISLIIQAVIYSFEYFFANFVSSSLVDVAIAFIICCAVLIALLSTTLSSMNTSARVIYATSKNHEKSLTPHTTIVALALISAMIGAYGVINIDNLTQVMLIFNVGAFLLYGITCVFCLLAFSGVQGRNWFTTIVAPVLGGVLSIVMLVSMIYFDITTQGSSIQHDTITAMLFSFAWLVIEFGYLFIRKTMRGISSIVEVGQSTIEQQAPAPQITPIAAGATNPPSGNAANVVKLPPQPSPVGGVANANEGRLRRKSAPFEVFCCYAREDKELLKGLLKHLRMLQRLKKIVIRSDIDLDAGVEWKKELHQYLESADIILLLISPDFIDSDYCYSVEMMRAIERHDQGSAVVIPILLRTTSLWHQAPFAKLQVVPKDARPVTTWSHMDDAFNDITKSIDQVVTTLLMLTYR